MANVLVPLYFFVLVGAVTLVPLWLAARARRDRLQLVREALSRNQPLDPALLALLADKRDPRGPFKLYVSWGIFGTFLGLGLFAASFLGPPEARSGLLIAAVINASLGVGLLLLAAIARGWSKERPES